MSIMFDWSSQSRAPFAGEWRFYKSRGLSASVSFLSLSHPLFLIFISPQFRAGKIPFLGLSLLLNPTKTLAMQAANHLVSKCCPFHLKLFCMFNSLVSRYSTNKACCCCWCSVTSSFQGQKQQSCASLLNSADRGNLYV